jgi:predicted NodU family carbamoyl transferase
LFYAQFTAWLGFERFQDEWKVMGFSLMDAGRRLEVYRVSDGHYSVNSAASE